MAETSAGFAATKYLQTAGPFAVMNALINGRFKRNPLMRPIGCFNGIMGFVPIAG